MTHDTGFAGFPVLIGVLKEERDDVEMVLSLSSILCYIFLSTVPLQSDFSVSLNVFSFSYKETLCLYAGSQLGSGVF